MNFKKLKECSLTDDFNIIMDKMRNGKKIKNIFQKLTKDGKLVNYSFGIINDNIYEKMSLLNGKSLKEYGNLKDNEITKIMDRLYYGRHSDNELYFRICENMIITVLKVFIESVATEYSFIGKCKADENTAVSKFSNFIITSDKRKYITRIDINVEDSDIEILLNNLNKYHNIKDTFFLSILKRFSYESSEIKKYLIELNLIIFDIMMENERLQNKVIKDYFTPKKIEMKGEDEYNKYRDGRTYPSYLRYYDEVVIISGSNEEAFEIKEFLERFLDVTTRISLSDKLQNTKIFEFLDYKISIKKENITVSLNDLTKKRIRKTLKKLSTKCKRQRNYYEYINYVVYIFYKYRICTSFKFIITSESNRLFRDLHHSKNIRYDRGSYNDGTFIFNTSNQYRKIPLNFWKIRELSNLSYSRLNRKSRLDNFNVDNESSNVLDYIKNRGDYSEYIQYIPSLLEKYNFKCPVSNLNLSYNNYEIHRITPRSKGGENELKNLIIIHKDVHRALHNKEKLYDNKTYKKLYNKIHK